MTLATQGVNRARLTRIERTVLGFHVAVAFDRLDDPEHRAAVLVILCLLSPAEVETFFPEVPHAN